MGEDRHYQAFRKMSEAYASAYQAGNGTAIEQMINLYGGPGTFAGWPQRVRDYASQTTPVNLLDWTSAYEYDLDARTACDDQNSDAGIVGRGRSSLGRTRQPAAGPLHPGRRRCHDRRRVALHDGDPCGEVAGMIAQHVARAEDRGGGGCELNAAAPIAALGDPRVMPGLVQRASSVLGLPLSEKERGWPGRARGRDRKRNHRDFWLRYGGEQRPLFGDGFTGTTELLRKILQLRQAIAHRQHRFRVVDVNAGGEGQRRDGRGEYVDEAERRMVGHQMAAAFRAVLALAERGLLERRHVLGTGGDPCGAAGFQRLNALTGPPDHDQQERQWQ